MTAEPPAHAAPTPSSRAPDDATFRQLVESLADAVVIADAEGTIVFWNAAATALFGWPAREAVGKSLDLIIPERLRERHWAGYRQTMATGHTDYGDRLLEVPALHRDDRPLSIAFTVTLLREADANAAVDANAAPSAIVAVIRDDTARWQERRQMKRELAELQRAAEAADGPS